MAARPGHSTARDRRSVPSTSIDAMRSCDPQAALKIAHLITGLSTGGAEQMLYKLLSGDDGTGFRPLVVSMTDRGPLGDAIADLGVPVYCLGMRRGVADPAALWKLWRILRRERPHLLQTWLYHADLLGLVAGKLARVPHVVWNVRCSDMDFSRYSALTGLTVRAGAWLSHWPDAVVVNSYAGKRLHEDLGYRPRRWEVIPNGFDLEKFQPDPDARTRFRESMGLPGEAFLTGHIARFDPMKDHETFLRAARMLIERRPDARFILVGNGVDRLNRALGDLVTELGLDEGAYLLGERQDVNAIMPALDIVSSSSAFGEGFPNVIGEAMACGVPCVVTDVGDSARLVANTGKVVPPRDPHALAAAWDELFRIGPDERQRLGLAARRRIQAHFSLPAIVGRYQGFYQNIGLAVRSNRDASNRELMRD